MNQKVKVDMIRDLRLFICFCVVGAMDFDFFAYGFEIHGVKSMRFCVLVEEGIGVCALSEKVIK